jgi:hypothetical protein
MRGLSCNTERGSKRPSATPNQRKPTAVARRSPFLVVAVFVCCAIPGWAQDPPQLPDGIGKETVQKACASCHALTTVTNAGHSRGEWTSVLSMMVTAGAPCPKTRS